MKAFTVLLLGLFACSHAFFTSDLVNAFNNVKNGVVHAAETVKDGVVSAANTVAGGVVDAAHAVAGGVSHAVDTLSHVDLSGVGHVLEQVWSVARGPLEEVGKQAATAAANYALTEGLSALAAAVVGKRDVQMADVRTYLNQELRDEFNQWYGDVQHQVLSSEREIKEALAKYGFENLPQDIKVWLTKYMKAKAEGTVNELVAETAKEVVQNAVQHLPVRMRQRMQESMVLLHKYVQG
ncbi:hypothetical protein ACJMK2_020275 [Sinanodonta woodiana]|uniref:Uncharacterized protein n=1 Tax=Sinanodonta woodiana TaxID=1069815 RepID=A0ABD3TYK1_SINWO